jgi:protein phosphatase 2C family protein 2/3
MEDAHACVLGLKPEAGETTNGEKFSSDRRISFFGVYDGHGGDKVAIYAGENLHKIIAKQDALKGGDVEKAIKDGFLATDRAILNGTIPIYTLIFVSRWLTNGDSDPKYEEEVSGCTACVALITDDKIYVVSMVSDHKWIIAKFIRVTREIRAVY